MSHAIIFFLFPEEKKEVTKKREFRALWIIRINAAVRQHGLSYSRFIASLKDNKIEINRKSLAYMAVHEPDSFSDLVKLISK